MAGSVRVLVLDTRSPRHQTRALNRNTSRRDQTPGPETLTTSDHQARTVDPKYYAMDPTCRIRGRNREVNLRGSIWSACLGVSLLRLMGQDVWSSFTIRSLSPVKETKY